MTSNGPLYFLVRCQYETREIIYDACIITSNHAFRSVARATTLKAIIQNQDRKESLILDYGWGILTRKICCIYYESISPRSHSPI